MKDAPLVSVMIPVWNGARFLDQAVASIRAQQYAPLEILVIDDGSTDETAHVAAQLGNEIRSLAFPHRGLALARQAGIEAARGELIAFLDVDDLWHENKLQLQLALLRDNPGYMIVNGHTQLMRLATKYPEPMRFENWGEPVLAPSFGSALFRAHVFSQLGLFDARLNPYVDVDWFLRARERGIPILIHPEIVQFYRRHEKNMSNDHALGKRAALQALKASLKRRSALGMEGVSLPPLTTLKDHV